VRPSLPEHFCYTLFGPASAFGTDSVAIHYENAPITEALIDIRVELPASETGLQVLESVHDGVKNTYPGKKKRLYLQGQLSAGDEVGASATQTVMGYSFSSEDGKQIFQARRDGFTFSRLRPYGSWPQLRDEARRLWHIYREAVNPDKVTRVAVRYINQIDIPVSTIDYKDYFRTTPEVSPELPQALSGFFMQLQFPEADFGGLLILTQTTVPPPNPATNSVILDLDVFKQTGLVSDDDVWGVLETLRNRKNEFFEGCITEKTRALFGRREEY
jgi:uncharacterized protein (TIGR04255 family)